MNKTYKLVAGSESKKELYESPCVEVINIDEASVICASGGDMFSLDDDRTIERGDDNDWGNNLNW